MDPNLSQTIIQILGSAAAFAAIKFYDARRDRRARARVEAKADEAVNQATKAAQQGATTEQAAKSSKASIDESSEALILLARELGRTTELSEKTLAAMHRMAEQNDNWFGAYTTLIAILRRQEERVGRLEEFAADQETTRYAATTGATNIHGGHDDDR